MPAGRGEPGLSRTLPQRLRRAVLACSSPAPRAAYLASSAISKDNTKCSEDVLVIVTSIVRWLSVR